MKVGLLDEQGRLDAAVRLPVPWAPSQSMARLVGQAFDWAAGWHRSFSAVAVSGCNPALLALDAQDRPLASPLFPPLEAPAEAETRSQFIPLIARFAREHPRLHQRARRYLCPAGALARYLTGEDALPLPRRPLYQPFFWSAEALVQAGLSSDLLPPFTDFTNAVGTLRPALRHQFGLKAGLPVFVVAVDFFSSLLGCAAGQPGVLVDRSGTSEGLNLVVEADRPPPAETSGLGRWPHPLEPLWVVSCQYPWVGSLFAWYQQRQQLGYDDLVAHLLSQPQMENLADWPLARLAATGHVFHPLHDRRYLHQPGLRGERLGRLILDYLALLFSSGVDRLRCYLADSATGVQPRRLVRLVLSGGQGYNARWLAYKSWRSGQNIVLPKVLDSELLGNAMVAAVGLGEQASLREAVLVMGS